MRSFIAPGALSPVEPAGVLAQLDPFAIGEAKQQARWENEGGYCIGARGTAP